MFSKLMGYKNENVSTIIKSTNGLKYKMIIHSFFIGILTGCIIVAYRIMGEKLLGLFANLYRLSKTNMSVAIGVLLVLILMALLVSLFIRQEPDISGSGIPQVEGVMTRRMKTNWWSVLVYKFFGGILCLAAGLSVGREGPSIQMGAAIGEGVSRKTNKLDYEHKYLMTSGASAGLAAAFNAPMAGVMFALEEVHKNFSPVVLLSAMVSAVTADMVTKSFLGISPSLRFEVLSIMPIKYYWSLLLLGILIGLSSYIFNHGVIMSKALYRNMSVKQEFKIIIPFIFAALIGMTFPTLLGGGHELIMNINHLHLGLAILLLYLLIKYLFTFASFGSGVPGGIFFPLLALGALMGNIFGTICVTYLGIPHQFLVNFAVLAMAGHFAATVKAPITGIILIFEMTGSFEHLLPLSVVVFSALITSDLLGVEPVYDMLLNDILSHKKDADFHTEDKNKTLMELSVHIGSQVEGKLISQVTWPDKCLVVAIYRGAEEIIPRGNTLILGGDMLLVMVNKVESKEMLESLTRMTSRLG